MNNADIGSVFPAQLLDWWEINGRHDLPWQQNKTLYRVWVSEIMLQQTQVTTVLNYYPRFMQSFPDVRTLAAASEDDVLHHWSGLGYYSRARNLHNAARQVVADYGGEVPADFDALLSLPGIGRSTAGAILALTCDRRFAILDGNAKRVLARLFAIEGWTGTTAALKQLWQLAEDCTPHARVADYTQAIMDLGATLCTRGKARCELCPVTGLCSAFKTNQVASIPAQKPKKVKPKREVAMVLAVSPAGVLLEKRPPSGIWAGLWSFPELDGPEAVDDWCRQALGCEPEVQQRWPAVAHSFTHFDLTMHPVEVRLADADERVMEADRWLWYNSAAPADVGLAAPVAKLLRQLDAGENNQGAIT
jgi:A/G-specific adenine glycosylase